VSEDPAGRRTEEALAGAGLADMRPAYRKLLVRLKASNAAGFEEATRRYREEVEPTVASGTADPVTTWLEYGTWLAGQLADGEALAIDPSGRARSFDPSTPIEPGLMILHLPEDDRAPVVLLAVPLAPSEPQRETADLLAG
jgi:hypothetical protein